MPLPRSKSAAEQNSVPLQRLNGRVASLLASPVDDDGMYVPANVEFLRTHQNTQMAHRHGEQNPTDEFT
jgi:hypothetical protein